MKQRPPCLCVCVCRGDGVARARARGGDWEERGRGSEVKDGCGRLDAVFRSTTAKRRAGAAASRFSRSLRGSSALGCVEVIVK